VGVSDWTSFRVSDIVGVYLVRQSKNQQYCCVISGRAGNKNINIVEVYLLGQAAETVILWYYISYDCQQKH